MSEGEEDRQAATYNQTEEMNGVVDYFGLQSKRDVGNQKIIDKKYIKQEDNLIGEHRLNRKYKKSHEYIGIPVL